MGEGPGQRPRRVLPATRDLMVVVLVAVAAFALAARFQLFEVFVGWAKHGDRAEADELVVVPVVLVVAFGVFSFRRWRELRRDIAARMEIEARLRRAETKYRALVEQIPAVTYISRNDEAFPLLYISPQVETLIGYTRDALYDDPGLWERHMHPDDLDRAVREFQEGVAGGRQFSTEYRIIRPDGRVLWVRDESIPLRDDSGRAVEIQGVIFDITERRQAEEAVRESEDRYRRLVELSPDAILVHSDGRFVFANQAAASLLGVHTPEELLGLDVLRVVHPDYHGIVKERISAERRGEPVPLIEERFVRLDGEVIDVEVTGMPVSYRGRPAGQIVVRDVTLRKQAERRLRETELRYRTVVEQMPAITYVDIADATTDSGYRTIYVSPQIEDILGWAAEEWVTHPGLWVRSLHADDRERALAEGARAGETGQPFSLDYRMIARDGRVVWLHDECVLVRDEEGRPSFWHGVQFDISKQKEAEEELRRADARYRTLVEQIPAITYVWDAAPEPGVGPLSYVSPQIESTLGFTVDEWMAHPHSWQGRVHPDDRERVFEATRRSVDAGEPFRMEYRMLAKDDRVVWLRDEALQIASEPGHPRLFQGVMFDVTERRRAEEERAVLLSRLVAAQEEERRRIAGDIHDDSVQKMTAVGLRLGALRKRSTDPGQLEAIDRLEAMVALAIDRLRHLLFELRPPAIDREGLAAALRQYLQDVQEEAGVDMHLDNRLASEPPADTRVIAYRIAQEALTNVRKHAHASRVEVLLQPLDAGLLVRITDDGVGFRDGRGLDGKPGHLGLAAMRERAQVAGGRFRVASTPGSGTMVEFWLPALGGGSSNGSGSGGALSGD